MSIRFQISLLIYIIVQAVVFGVGIVIALAPPWSAYAMQSLPWVVVVSAVISAPLSWMIAPRLRARFESRSAPLAPSA